MNRSILRAAIFLLLWAAPAPSQAGILDWFLPRTADWNFIQATGGMTVLNLEVSEGKTVLPVLYDASGMSEVTRKPTRLNSGLVVHSIKVTHKGTNLVLVIKTCLRKDLGSTEGAGRVHYADLSGIPKGTYQIFYGRANDPAAVLGQIQIK
jgi:hypothetical protein